MCPKGNKMDRPHGPRCPYTNNGHPDCCAEAIQFDERERIAKFIEAEHLKWFEGRNENTSPGQWADLIRSGAVIEEKKCEHDWKDIRNKVIESGELCFKCGAIR